MSPPRIDVEESDLARPSSAAPAPRGPIVPAVPPRLLRRPAVEALIRAGAHHRLLLVTGPAGHGKTTTTAAALRDTVALAWVTLGPSDRDPVRLQRRIVEALGSVGGFRAVPVTSVEELDDALASCCRQLADAGEIVLVLDDEGDALQSRAAARRVERVLDRLPDGLHTVVLSRRRPPIGTERRRARGEVAEVGVRQLTFADDEVAACLNGVWDLALDEAAVRQIVELAEGWPVVLQTVAARIATEPAVLGSDGRITDARRLPRLLVRELLDALTAGDRRFLVDISVLTELSAARCERLTERTAAAERLERLRAAGLIVASETGGGYRHRPLVLELLTEELRALPGRATALHASAASMYRDEGAWAEAVDHCISADDVDLALDWVEQHLGELLHVDRRGWLDATLGRLPARCLTDRPRLLVWRVDLALLSGDRDALETTLATLEDPGVDPRERVEGIRRVHAALARLRGDGVEPLVGIARGTFEPILAHPLGVALAAEGRHEAASVSLRRARDDARRRGDPLRELAILADLAWQRAVAGLLVDADLLARRSASIARERGFAAPPLRARLAVAQIASDRERTGIAHHDALQVRAAASDGFDLTLRADAGMLVSRALWAHGDTSGAVRALEDVDRELRDHTPGGGLISRVARAKASLRLALGDVEGAVACVPWVTTGLVDELPPADRLIAAQVHLELGAAHRARAAITSLRDAGIGPRLTIDALRIEASACNLLGEDLDAERIRRRAEQMARGAGLLAHGASRELPRPRDVSAPSAPSAPIERLTEREFDVLRRLPSSTNVDIAAALLLSTNTVKTHLKSIYRKLGVGSRDAAVDVARRLEMV
jgi:LuxR family transcriptional regulator, maltose regulon positive regulatory protein